MTAARSTGSVELWSSGDICRQYAISRNTLQKWRRAPGFPDPLLWDRNRGGVWAAAAVRSWKATRDSSSATRRSAAVSRYRETGNVSQVAREVGVARSTVRSWVASEPTGGPARLRPRAKAQEDV